MGNRSTIVLQTGHVYGQNDALELLYQATQEHSRDGSFSGKRPDRLPDLGVTSPGSQRFFASPNAVQGNGIAHGSPFGNQSVGGATSIPQNISDPIVTTWSRFRFVRAGWFRAEEGMMYIEYFYKNLYPLTPLAIPNYENRATHTDLLEEEPMLALTILTIASRYMQLPGPGGNTRGTIIHQRLNDSMHKEINRTIWGQKQFGGGFCRAGARSPNKVDHLWETLGVIEALMLLTEWHPRAMHFPPDDDDGELMIPENPGQTTATTMGDIPIRIGGPEGRRVDSWLEPCWRSDRMCWLLLGIADSLAWEIGVYDETTEGEFRQYNPNLSFDKVKMYFDRKNHLKELLPLFKVQTSGRLELTSHSPTGRSLVEEEQSLRPEERLINRIKKLGLESRLATTPPTANYLDLLNIISHLPQDLVIHFWSEATIILDAGNHKLYHSRKHTQQIVESGEYTELIVSYKQWLQGWLFHFQNSHTLPSAMRYILRIEYEYSRAFLCALALQAVIQRCIRHTPLQHFAELAASGEDSGEQDNGQEPKPFTPADYRKWVGSDSPHIKECIDACRDIFRAINEAPGEYLRHCPVRTYFRIISAALLLMKTFITGATEADMAETLILLDTAMQKLRDNIVDDVHVGNRFADMCITLTKAARYRLIRVNREGVNGASRSETPGPNSRGVSGGPSMPLPGNGASGLSMMNGSVAPSNINSGQETPSHPALWGISNHVYAPTVNDVSSFMPPPETYYANGYPTNVDGTVDGFNDPLQDWLTLPYADLVAANGEVGIGPNGPSIGGDDILDKLLFNFGANPGPS